MRSVVAFAASLHLMWGVLIYFSASALDVTALVGFRGIPVWVVEIVLVSVAMCAFIAISISWTRKQMLMWLLPQQMILLAGAGMAGVSMWNGAYPDGTTVSSIHLVTDQVWVMLLAVWHIVEMYRIHGNN